MKKILSVCCLVLVGNVGIAFSQTSKPRGYDPLVTKLASVKWLSNHDHGFGGSNEFYKLSKEFLESHNASDFKRMVHSRNPIVKAMGLLCLAKLDPDKYWFTLLSHGKDNEEVYLHEGCLVSKVTIGEFTLRLLSNPYFLDAEPKRPQEVLARLARYEPQVNWDSLSMLKADFDHDGKDDYAFNGTQGGIYVVAIIGDSANDNPHHWVFRFSVASPSHKINEICSLKTATKTRSPVILGSGKQMWRIPANSKALVVDDGCDPVNITWDQDKRNFELLRIHVLM